MEKKLTFREKLACKVLSLLRWNEKDEFYKCNWNDSILAIAAWILKGRNPVEFMIWVLDIKKADYWGLGDYRPDQEIER